MSQRSHTERLLAVATCMAEAGHGAAVGGSLAPLSRAFRADRQLWGALAQHAGPLGRTHLMYAALRNDAGRVGFLLDRGAAAGRATPQGASAMRLACQGGHEAVVRLLAGSAPPVAHAACAPDGATPLMIACQAGHLDIARHLVEERGAEAGAALAGCGGTPLTLAAQRGHEAVVRFLVTCRAVGVDARTSDGSTALTLACQEGHQGVARCLVEEGGADVGAVRASDGRSALMLIIGRGADCLEAVHCLLRHGARASINAVCSAGGTALSCAAAAGSATLIHVLYSCGADANVQGMAPSPLMLALNSGRDEVALALVECGAACDEAGYLDKAVRFGCVKVVRTLLQRGTDFKTWPDQGFRLIGAAMGLSFKHEILEALLKHGGGSYMKTIDSSSLILIMASDFGNPASFPLLCAHGADPNAALTTAIVSMDAPVGATPLMLAARQGSMGAVLALLKLGARPLTKDAAGRAASDYATDEEIRKHLVSLS